MSWLKKSKLAFHVLLFLTVISVGTLFAQVEPKTPVNQGSEYSASNQPKTTPANTVQTPASAVGNTSNPAGSNPSANYLPTPNGSYQPNLTLPNGQTGITTAGCGLGFTVPVVGGVCNSIKSVIDTLADCGANVFCYMSGGIEVVERKVMDQTTGCGSVDTPSGYQDCQKKYQALLNGGSLAQVQNPGALFILGDIADKGLTLPVPIDSKQYLATINPLQAPAVHAQAAQELDSSGLVKIWQNIRNAALALSAVVLVVIGFMIMFRARLDPRTSITAMNSLPKVIFALILIYFSFALSGFMLDLGRLVLQIIYSLIPFSGGSIASGLLELLVIGVIGFVGVFLVTGGVAGVGVVATVLAAPLLILALLLALALFIVVLNLIFKMIQRYVQFIVYTIFSPLFFLWGAMPGQSSFGWFKSQLSNVIAIPAMMLVIRLAAYIGFNSFNLGRGSSISLPSPFASGFGTSGTTANIFWFILAPLVTFGMLFYATKMPAIIDGVLGIRDYGARAGIGPGVLLAPVGMATMAGKNAGYAANFLNLYGGVGKNQTRSTGRLPGAGTAERLGGWINNIVSPGRGGGGAPCLTNNTSIKTSIGDVLVQNLKKGMLVWSLNEGQRIKSRVIGVQKTPIGQTHTVVSIVLKDGRALTVSSNHPLVDNRKAIDLLVGDIYDGSVVKKRKILNYTGTFTYDLLLDSETGFYWANGILLASTMTKEIKKPVHLQNANIPAET